MLDLLDIGKDRRYHIIHPEGASRWNMWKRQTMMFLLENDAYGFVYCDPFLWKVIQMFGLPFGGTAAVYLMGRDYPAVVTYAYMLALACFLKLFIVCTRPEDLLDGKKEFELPIEKIRRATHDTFYMTLKYDKGGRFGMAPFGHIKVMVPSSRSPESTVKGEWNGEPVDESEEFCRKYTPTRVDEANGEVELLVKVYHPNERFCDGGRVSRSLEGYQIGDTVKIGGPVGKYKYELGGIFAENIPGKGKKYITGIQHLGMICGGSGVTPVLQVAAAVLDDIYAYEDIQISIIACNKESKDILCKKEFESLVNGFPDRIKVHYMCDKKGENEEFEGSIGFVCKETIKNHFPPPGDNTLVYMCGPKPMLDLGKKICTELKYKPELIWP